MNIQILPTVLSIHDFTVSCHCIQLQQSPSAVTILLLSQIRFGTIEQGTKSPNAQLELCDELATPRQPCVRPYAPAASPRPREGNGSQDIKNTDNSGHRRKILREEIWWE